MLDLKSNELDWLATHLGHNIAVHREFYRLPMNVVEVAKVGKLLTAVEKGVQRYSGKSLDEIDLTDIGRDCVNVVMWYVVIKYGMLGNYCLLPDLKEFLRLF